MDIRLITLNALLDGTMETAQKQPEIFSSEDWAVIERIVTKARNDILNSSNMETLLSVAEDIVQYYSVIPVFAKSFSETLSKITPQTKRELPKFNSLTAHVNPVYIKRITNKMLTISELTHRIVMNIDEKQDNKLRSR